MEQKNLVFKTISLIPAGKVTTYKRLGRLTGIKNLHLIGKILHQNKDPRSFPCHRVVYSCGKVSKNYAFGGKNSQIKKLKKEGVKFKNEKIKNLEEYLWKPNKIEKLFISLLKEFGDPGPWPWYKNKKTSSKEEIAIGAILTQNTSWRNVEYAIANLKKEKMLSLKKIYETANKNIKKLEELIRPSGFYKQKAKKLYLFSSFITKNYQNIENFLKLETKIARKKLINLWGIGEETADTILLYCGNKPTFVIDKYTKRILEKRGITKETNYQKLQKLFLGKIVKKVQIFKDFHALIVLWGKKNRSKT